MSKRQNRDKTQKSLQKYTSLFIYSIHFFPVTTMKFVFYMYIVDCQRLRFSCSHCIMVCYSIEQY